ncbi:MAG TPA: hypothetical protein VGO59_15625 [Verrucomicrobiae bacterium]
MNIKSQPEQQMKTTRSNRPDIETLPEGAKKMLLISEAHFSHQPGSPHPDQGSPIKPNSRRPLTFGDFVAGVYHTWGKRKAKGIVQLALKMNVVEFRGTERFVIS